MSLTPGFHPFWFWNDRLEADEVCRQIRLMKDQGVKGFYIHSRQGLQQPYLGEAFLDMVSVAVDEAERLGLTVHLYDEYPYPSGIAGGRVTLGRPSLLATHLTQLQKEVDGGPLRLALPCGHILDCRAFPLREGKAVWDEAINLEQAIGPVLAAQSYNEVGLTPYNRKRFFASQPTPILETVLPPGRWRLHIAVQVLVDHHKYWGHFADVMQPEVIACFLQETHERYRRRLGASFGSVIASVFVDETAPGWTPNLPLWFRQRWDHELDFPALADESHPRHLRTRQELQTVQYERFCQSFEEPIRDWCAQNNLRYAGEKPVWKLDQLRFMDLPGCEPGHVKTGAPLDLLGSTIRGNAKAVSSAAFFYDKEGALCECYHSLGWSANLQDAKRIAEGLMLCGVDFLVPHGFFYSTHGLRKHDAPPSFFHQMPFWPLFGQLSSRLDRLQAAWAGMCPAPQVLLIDPTDSLPTREQNQTYLSLQQELMARHIEFLMADRDILQSGSVRDGRLHLHNIEVQAVLVPPLRQPPEGLAKLLEQLASAGLPVHHFTDDTLKSQVSALYDQLDLPLRLAGDCRDLWLGCRAKETRFGWFLLNTANRPLTIQFSGPELLGEISLEPECPPQLRRDGNGWCRNVAPNESFFLTNAGLPAQAGPVLQLTIPDNVALHPLQPNLLRLGDWEFSLCDENGNWSPARTVPAVPLANQLAHSRLPFPPNLKLHFGQMPDLTLPRLQVRYETTFDRQFSSPVQLVMEPGAIVGDWTLSCNGRQLNREDLIPYNHPVHGCLALDLTPHLLTGNNRLRIDLTTDLPEGGLLTPLHLAGDFGVCAGPTLTPPAREGRFDDFTANRLPYYAGTLEAVFQTDLPPMADPVCVELTLPAGFTDAVELAFGEGPFHPLPWEPRRLLLSAGELHPTLRLRVHTSLSRAFEGQYFNTLTHETRPVILPEFRVLG